MTTYTITGMTCMTCVSHVTEALKHTGAAVTLSPPQAIIDDARDPGLAAVQAALAGSKYTASQGGTVAATTTDGKSWLQTYAPLFTIIAYISVVSFAGTGGSWHGWMLHFMAGFYLVFSFFKFLDLRGFADAYAGYDLLAKKWHGYGFVYPFLELGLGLCFAFQVFVTPALVFSVILMAFGSIGVIQAVMNKQKIRCACLGSVLNLPMSTITIVEDLGMMAMGIVMLMA